MKLAFSCTYIRDIPRSPRYRSHSQSLVTSILFSEETAKAEEKQTIHDRNYFKFYKRIVELK